MNPSGGDRESDRSDPTSAVDPIPQRGPTKEVGPNLGGTRASRILKRVVAFAHRFEFATGTMGFLFGLAIMTWGSLPWPGSGHSSDAFLRAPEALVWVFLIAAEFAFWFSALPFQWHWRCAIRDEFRIQPTSELRGKHILAVLMFIVPAAILALAQPPIQLTHHREKVLLVNLVAVFAAVVAIQGIWYVRAALGDVRWGWETPVDETTPAKEKVRDYLSLRESLQRFIAFLGMMISLGTLAKGGLRHAFVATGGSPSAFPPEYVLLHGAYFTGLLALVYVPTYTRLAAAGGALLDSVFTVTAPDVELRKLSEWQSNRKSLEELLQLRSTALHNLRASVVILAPLGSATLSVLLGDKLLLDTK
jgi:hypothetical protein